MPKKVKISLKGIVQQIDQATKHLEAAKGKVATAMEKKELEAKIKDLKEIKKDLKQICLGLNILVPPK